LEPFGPLGAELEALLRRRNGFDSFESALHLFPYGRSDRVLDLDTWNASGTWRETYGNALDGCLFFAEDAFGFPFCIEADAVRRCDAETGERVAMGASIEEWASQILIDWRFLTGQPLAHEGKSSTAQFPSDAGSHRANRSFSAAASRSRTSTPPTKSSS